LVIGANMSLIKKVTKPFTKTVKKVVDTVTDHPIESALAAYVGYGMYSGTSALSTMSPMTKKIIGGAAIGAVTSKLAGGSYEQGAVVGGAAGAASGLLGNVGAATVAAPMVQGQPEVEAGTGAVATPSVGSPQVVQQSGGLLNDWIGAPGSDARAKITGTLLMGGAQGLMANETAKDQRKLAKELRDREDFIYERDRRQVNDELATRWTDSNRKFSLARTN